MQISDGNVIIHGSTCICSSVHTVTVHHRNYPELAAEAITAARAIAHLEQRLEQALDYDSETWRREALRQAIADVRRYASTLPAALAPARGRLEQPQGCTSVRPD